MRGAEVVNVRRGPNPNSPVLTSLPKGSRVTVEAIEGQWARVTLASGKLGFMNAAFIEVHSQLAVGTPSEATPTPAVGPVARAEGAPAPPTSSIEAELAQLRHRLAVLESSSAATPSPAALAAAAVAPTAAIERLAPTASAVITPSGLDVGPALALAGVCVVVGFLIGTLYGQRQERRSRMRVRF
ncbi:MAG: SH3 domain-containing protein [Candidatus Binatia bacterium]